MGPEDTNWIAVVQSALLITFCVLIIAGAISTTNRLRRYLKRRERAPKILYRDVIARLSLAVPFACVLGVRVALMLDYDISWFIDSWLWVLFTTLPAVAGAMIYLYFEMFVIERDEDFYPRSLVDESTRPDDDPSGH